MLSFDEVVQAFIWLLDRRPESDAVTEQFAHFTSAGELRSYLMKLPEFYNQIRAHGNLVPENNWVCKEVGDLAPYRLWLNLFDKGVSIPCLLNQYEDTETRLVKSLVFAGDTFCDFGANIGWFSLLAASLVGRTGKVYSFEPSPYIYPYLARSIHDSGFDSIVSLHRIALGTVEEFVTLERGEETVNPGGSSISSIENHNQNDRTYFVKSQRLDDVITSCRPSFIKVDVEGAELLALKGAEATILRSSPIIMCEINPEALRIVSKCTTYDLVAYVCSLGYVPMTIGEHSLTPSSSAELALREQGWFNVIFCPNQMCGFLTSLRF